MKNKIDIIPCKKCKSTNIHVGSISMGDSTYVVCKNCKNTVIGGYFKKETIKKWNKENE